MTKINLYQEIGERVEGWRLWEVEVAPLGAAAWVLGCFSLGLVVGFLLY